MEEEGWIRLISFKLFTANKSGYFTKKTKQNPAVIFAKINPVCLGLFFFKKRGR